jgi:hypothetical protein
MKPVQLSVYPNQETVTGKNYAIWYGWSKTVNLVSANLLMARSMLGWSL